MARSAAEAKNSKGFRNMKIWFRGSGWAPRVVAARFLFAFYSKEVDSPMRVGIELWIERLERDCHFGCPGMRRLIYVGRTLQPAFQIGQRSVRNCEVDPHSVGADLKFFVFMGPGGIRLDKDFSNIAVPQVVTVPVCVRIFEYVKFAEFALEAQIELLIAP